MKNNIIKQPVKNSIIIPAYNEEAALPLVLKGLKDILDENFEIIVVDDGSRDRTVEIAKEHGVKTLVHPVNMGKGAAMRTGIEKSRGKNVIFMDADNTYPSDAILTIADLLDQHDMVVGIRETKGNIAAFNRFGNEMFSKMFKFFYKTKVSDPLSGLYGLKKSCLDLMQLSSFGFEIETEITIKASRMDLDVKEIPIQYDERIGETKLNPVTDGFRILSKILTFSFVFNPNYSFIFPGMILFMLSLTLFFILSFSSITVAGIRLDIHSLIFSCMSSIVGFQILTFGLISKIYGTLYKNIPADSMTDFILKKRLWKPAAGLGLISTITGFFMISRIFYLWIETGFSPIMKLHEAILSFFLFIMGIQIIFSTFFLSIFAKDIINQKGRLKFLSQIKEIK